MKKAETLLEFYHRVPQANPAGLGLHNAGLGHFNVFPRNACHPNTTYSRRDFYKVSLIIGTGNLHYADKWISLDRPALLFSNPVIPYSWEAISEIQEGYFCLFTEAFVHPDEKKATLQDSPLFRIGGNPVFFIDDKQQQKIKAVFEQMLEELDAQYLQKYDLLRNYLHVIIHEAMKMQPAESFEKNRHAPARITSLFLELLERQFPIDTPENSLRLKTANDYAKNLSVHPNHLNRSVKEITGKTTTGIIAERITKEAQALLKHTNWDIAEVAYSLGFEYPAYFSNFFKKHTGIPPGGVRNQGI